MSGPNDHIRIRDGMRLIGGSPLPYLNGLREAKTKFSTFADGKIPRPHGKLGFAQFAAAHGGRSVRTLAAISGGLVHMRGSDSGVPLAQFLKKFPPGRYFCKPNRGSNGGGAFRLGVSKTGFTAGDEDIELSRLEQIFVSQDYLVQEWLAPLQHAAIARLREDVVSTMRLVTFSTPDGIKPAAALLRIANANGTVDNWSQGGVAVPIDLDREALGPCGVLKDDLSLLEAHPQSGIVFKDQPVPFAKEALALAVRLHDKLAIASIGWDIALLQNGPCLIESNASWDIYLAAQLNPAFVRQFHDFHLAETPELAVRLEFTGKLADRDRLRRWLSAAAGSGLLSGRVEQCSQARLAVLLSGARRGIDTSIAWMKQTASRAIGASEMRRINTVAPALPGLDIEATFSESVLF